MTDANDEAGPPESRGQAEPGSKDVQEVTQSKEIDDNPKLKRKASDKPAAGADEAAASKRPRGQPAPEATVDEGRNSSGDGAEPPQDGATPAASRAASGSLPPTNSSAAAAIASTAGAAGGGGTSSMSAASGMTPLCAAYSEDKGCRTTLEDVSVILIDGRPPELQQTTTCRVAHFGVFDGHGGVSCATHVSQQLHKHVLQAGLLSKGLPSSGKVDAKACKAAIAEGFKSCDTALLNECAAKGWQDGACAVAVWVVQDLVLVANVGDAKCVLARAPEQKGQPAPAPSAPKAIVLTKEHTALVERQRIEKAGGAVVDGRLAGRMQVSRSFGDPALKKVGCISTPDVTAFPLTARDEFLLLGCDGFWGVFGAQEAVDTAMGLLREGKDPKSVTNRMLNIAVREKRCKDNVSLLLVRFGSR